MRRTFLVVLVLVLAACGGAAEPETAPPVTTTTSTTVANIYDEAFARCAETARQRWEADEAAGVPYPSTHERMVEVENCAADAVVVQAADEASAGG